jgi:vitamin B12 transporter
MRSPKGFRGKYFSLAAILALSTTITLANQVQSTEDVQKSVQTKEEYDENEELTPSTEELDVAVVAKKIKVKKSQIYSASKSYLSKTNVTDNVNILTSEEMKLQGFVTVDDALKSLPGLSVTSSGGLGQTSSVFLQGMANQYLLVLVDGVKYNDPANTSGARLDTLLVDDIDKIEVIKGAQSGVWGADAAAGVINIITKRATPGVHASIGVEAGSYKTRTLSASLSQKTHIYDVMLSYLRITSNGFSAQVPYGKNVDDYESDAYRNTTLNFKGGYWLDADNRIEAGYQDINSLTHYDASSPNSDGRSDYRSKQGYITYKHYVAKHLIEATLSEYQSEYKDLDLVYSPWYDQVGYTKGQTPSFELKDTYKYAKEGMLVFGGSLENRKITYTKVGSSEEEKKEDKNRALFINNVYDYKNFVFSQALRYDYFNAFKNKVTGKVGLKYNFNSDLNVYANYGTAYKTPNILQMIYPWGTGHSNFDLKPENIKSFNVGVEYQGLHVNYFKNKIQDMISYGTNSYENLEGTSTLQGLEVSYQQIFFKKLLLGTNYTYVDAKDKDGQRLIRRPRYQVGINVSYLLMPKVTVSANGTYLGSRLDTDYSTSSSASVQTGRYFVANTKVDYRLNKTFSTYIKCNNIFDKIYQDVYGYGTTRRSFYVGFNAKF